MYRVIHDNENIFMSMHTNNNNTYIKKYIHLKSSSEIKNDNHKNVIQILVITTFASEREGSTDFDEMVQWKKHLR